MVIYLGIGKEKPPRPKNNEGELDWKLYVYVVVGVLCFLAACVAFIYHVSRKYRIKNDIIPETKWILTRSKIRPISLRGREKFTKWGRQPTMPQAFTRTRQLPNQMSLNLPNVEFTVKGLERKEQPSLGQLQPDLYKPQQTVIGSSNLPKESSNAGTITFSLKYDHEAENLLVCLIRATNLPAKDFSGTSDPYVKVYLLPDRKNKFQTRIHKKNLNPDFCETCHFTIPYRELPGRMLQMSVYDFDRFSRHDLIGRIIVKDLLESGDLSCEEMFTLDLKTGDEEKDDLGELMFSMCYLPTAGRLTVTIVKAMNLKAMDITGASDPYVKISLFQNGKRVKKKKTSVKRNTLNPVYNEAIVFDIPPDQMDSVSLLIHVVDYDRIGHSELIGCVELGKNAKGLGKSHWTETIASPRKPIAYWHTLVDEQSIDSNLTKQCAKGANT